MNVYIEGPTFYDLTLQILIEEEEKKNDSTRSNENHRAAATGISG